MNIDTDMDIDYDNIIYRERRRRVTGRSPEFGTNFETIVGLGS